MEDPRLSRLEEKESVINDALAEIDEEITYLENQINVPDVQPETGYSHVVVLDNLPVVNKDKLEKLHAVIVKCVNHASGNQALSEGVHLQFDEETGKSRR
tara:strand:- start:279 stop:578 length:300 start_codon:yes stop_codon:yes gene_type:complete